MIKLKDSRTTAKGKIKAPRDGKTSSRLPDLEGILSRSIEEYAGCDLFDDSTQSLLYGHLLDTIARLRGEVVHLRKKARKPPPPCLKCAKKMAPVPEPVEKSPARFQILHRIFCVNLSHNHNCAIYEDEPTRSTSSGLKGNKRVTNIDHYCTQHKDLSFILFNEHSCIISNMSAHNSTDRKNFRISSRKERLLVVSDILQKALNQVALCSPQDTKDDPGVIQMHAPYLFLYHHRTLLLDLAATTGGETEEHVSLLLSFINEHYGDEYKEAERLFNTGIITKEHVEKLYRPNSIVIDKTGPQDRAYVIKSWLEVDEGDMELLCWSWEYDGSFLKREETHLKMNAPSVAGSALSVIGVFPISMIDHETLENLRLRGQKFWSMKGQHFTCYSGYDVAKMQFHVSKRSAFSMHQLTSLSKHKARFMIDTSTYFRMHQNQSPRPSHIVPQFDPWPPFIPRRSAPDDSSILLLPPAVHAFDLQDKKWGMQIFLWYFPFFNMDN